MNLGVEEQAQRRKKDKKGKRSSRKKNNTSSQEPIHPSHRRIFQTKIIKMQQRKIGLIIGQSGKNIKELYKHTHCDIILPKQKRKKEEETFIDNSVDNSDIYYVYDSYNNTEQTNLYFKDIEDEKQSKSKKDKKQADKDKDEDEEEEDLDDPRRLIEVKLRGTPEEIRDAELEINFMIKHGRLMLEHERGGDKNAHKNEYEDEHDDEIAEDLRIPSKICGMLIGGGGQRVKELMQETGAEIWVDWDKESHIEAGVSCVHLKGTKYNVEMAKEEIKRIQNLFEKGSNNFRFEIPSYCSRDLFGEGGANLTMLQKQYNVSITVKNYRHERRSIRVGDQEERIQRTMMVILIGEEEDQLACKQGIDKLVGTFIKCQQCNNLKKDDDGYEDNRSGAWFCQDCWDEFNGVVKKEDDNKNYNVPHLTNKMQELDMSKHPSHKGNYGGGRGGDYGGGGGGRRPKPIRKNKW